MLTCFVSPAALLDLLLQTPSKIELNPRLAKCLYPISLILAISSAALGKETAE
jgi:hypothetical protein